MRCNGLKKILSSFESKNGSNVLFCYRAEKYLEDDRSKTIKMRRIKEITRSNNYNDKIVHKIIRHKERNDGNDEREGRKFMGSVTYIG